jgi:hypothetical protein
MPRVLGESIVFEQPRFLLRQLSHTHSARTLSLSLTLPHTLTLSLSVTHTRTHAHKLTHPRTALSPWTRVVQSIPTTLRRRSPLWFLDRKVVWVAGFWVWGVGCRVWGLELGVQGLGSGVQGLGFGASPARVATPLPVECTPPAPPPPLPSPLRVEG